MKKKYTVYGNCQARVLPSVLGSSKLFKDRFEYVNVNAVHNLTSEELDKFINDHLTDLDLFIFQPVSDKFNKDTRYSTNYLLDQLKESCMQVSFPSCYFRGYNPEINYLKSLSNSSITDRFDYHDYNVLIGSIYKDCTRLVEDICSNFFYDKNFSLKAVNDSLNEIKKRENSIFSADRQIDIKISDFIEENFRQNRLFYTVNHPSSILFKYIGEQILLLLELEDEITFSKDPLAHTVYPVYNSHYKNLNCSFDNPLRYKIKDEIYQLQEVICLYLEYYYTLPKDIIEKNLIRILQ